ncbi:uncharacterized protein METZ01_LOCUS246850, partial [marine metagenome]
PASGHCGVKVEATGRSQKGWSCRSRWSTATSKPQP